MVEKPWGCETLPAPFVAPPGQRVGEVWFEPPHAMPGLLAKYIFTSERLSIQNHPGGASGKEECWLVIAAQPGATLGIGFREPVSPERLRDAALDGSIVDLMVWHPVKVGDFFHIMPGTVHAIGAGVSLIEVQQANDITFRLYDYGRPRELHLDSGLAVALGEAHDPSLRRHVPASGNAQLVEGAHFRLDRIEGRPSAQTLRRYSGSVLVLPRLGTVSVAGEAVRPGQCALAASLSEVTLPARAQALIAQPTQVNA